ncbi:hypothetical protein B7494_g2912 [Chlorociboria aeruginascens]|nr:hypothetical protein B7494_g2912 [Chlorociboria aeruginascens]
MGTLNDHANIMAPQRSRKRASVTVKSVTSSSDNEDDAIKIMLAAQGVISAERNRRDSKRKAVLNDHNARVQAIGEKMEKLFKDRKARVVKLQLAQWEKFDTLNKKRQLLEEHILSSMRSIERLTANFASEMIAVLEGRIEEMENAELPS